MKSLLLFVTYLVLSSSLQAQILLDQVMSKEEQQKTGVANLSVKQKIALEAWLNKNFVLKQPAKSSDEQLTLSINIDNGKKLQLSDNSLWEVSPEDISTAAIWITPFPIQISKSNDPDYPYLLVNKNTHTSVKARKISTAIPPGISPPAQQ